MASCLHKTVECVGAFQQQPGDECQRAADKPANKDASKEFFAIIRAVWQSFAVWENNGKNNMIFKNDSCHEAAPHSKKGNDDAQPCFSFVLKVVSPTENDEGQQKKEDVKAVEDD